MSTQGPDWIAFRGRTRMMLSTPLEAYLRKLPGQPDFRLTAPDYRRGYMARWEVRPDDTLWLTGLKTRRDDDGPDPGLQLVFPTAAGPLAATWVSQLLRCPDGERRYDQIGYGSKFARETYLAVWDGKVVMLEEVDGRSQRVTATEFTHHLESVFGAEESAFLRAIGAAPDDSAPRLVYADWLDERQDPRADLVRLTERLRGLAPDVAARLREANQEVIRRARGHWLWGHIVTYDPNAGGVL